MKIVKLKTSFSDTDKNYRRLFPAADLKNCGSTGLLSHLLVLKGSEIIFSTSLLLLISRSS